MKTEHYIYSITVIGDDGSALFLKIKMPRRIIKSVINPRSVDEVCLDA